MAEGIPPEIASLSIVPELSNYTRKLIKKGGINNVITLLVLQHELLLNINKEEKRAAHKFLRTFHDELRANSERIDLIHEKLEKYKFLDDKFKLDTKSDSKATRYRDRATKFFAIASFDKAFRCYTKMLMQASSPELINTAYMHRSATLFKLKLYDECVTDIDRALADGNCSEYLKRTLTTRRAKALELGKKSKSSLKPYEEPPQIPTNQRNPALNCAKNCIEVKYDCKQRRRVVAARDINVGEVVVVETPFCAITRDAPLYHCHECFELCYTLIPCGNCTQALYCSDTCRQSAYDKFHKDECPILKSLKHLVGKDRHYLMGLKMALLNQDEQADEVLKFATELDDKNNICEPFIVAMAAAFMYDFLKKHTQKFQGENNGEQMERNFKDSILHYLRICIIKTTKVSEFCPNSGSVIERALGEDTGTFASAIYPVCGLFRHSCCPNIFPSLHGLKRVMRAVRTIKKGEECFITYGPVYSHHPKEERQHQLYAQHHFTCKCRACTENWPQVDLKYLAIDSDDDYLICMHLANYNVEFAKRVIPELVQEIKDLERFERRKNFLSKEIMLQHCYDLLGNKRMIL